jgi:hypothetical protein
MYLCGIGSFFVEDFVFAVTHQGFDIPPTAPYRYRHYSQG